MLVCSLSLELLEKIGDEKVQIKTVITEIGSQARIRMLIKIGINDLKDVTTVYEFIEQYLTAHKEKFQSKKCSKRFKLKNTS